jgi:hypothetical protein
MKCAFLMALGIKLCYLLLNFKSFWNFSYVTLSDLISLASGNK